MTTQEDSRIARRKELEEKLSYFTGTEQWYRIYESPQILATDGVMFVMKTAQAFWLSDTVFALNMKKEIREEPFQYYELTVDLEKKAASLKVTDGNENKLHQEEIPYCDFPLPTFKFYFSDGVMLLPSEY